MSVIGNVILAAVSIVVLVYSAYLHIRYLQDGVAYVVVDEVVMDRTITVGGIGLAIVAVIGTAIVLWLDPSYAHGPGILWLGMLIAGGLGGLLSLVFFRMDSSSMSGRIEHSLPLFLRDRTPGCVSTRTVMVQTGTRTLNGGMRYRTIRLR